LYDRKGFEPPAYTPTGRPSIKRDLLKEIIFDLGDSKCQFLDDYMNWKLLSTILSKVFYPLLRGEGDWHDPDGRVRTSFTISTKTGRTSSKKPNLQNIPTPEKEPGTLLQYLPAKNCFTHTWPDGCLLMVDFSGMELRVISSVAGIQGMVEVFARGGDVHKYVSSLIYGIPEEEITKFQRYRGKWCNWSLLYLGNWWTLYRMYRINGLTESEAKRVTKLYFENFPELSIYHGETISFAEEHGYVESPFGRILQLPTINSKVETVRKDTQRTAVNMPIQGTASDVLLLAMYIVDQFLYDEGLESFLVNTVHDSIVLDICPGELEPVKAICIDVMENIVHYAQDFAPNLDFSWLRVPLKADADIGTHYGSYGLCKRAKCDHCGSHNVVFEKAAIRS
jgi:DNA polymerase I-like protein with 3'-5' exonuclease and polymerase domains